MTAADNNGETSATTHPGKMLKEIIGNRGISQRRLAEQTGIAYPTLNEILNARRPITEKTAMVLEAALGVSAETLIRMQTRYNIKDARKDKSFMHLLDSIRKTAAIL